MSVKVICEIKELSDLRTQKEEELETLTNRWMELEEKGKDKF